MKNNYWHDYSVNVERDSEVLFSQYTPEEMQYAQTKSMITLT